MLRLDLAFFIDDLCLELFVELLLLAEPRDLLEHALLVGRSTDLIEPRETLVRSLSRSALLKFVQLTPLTPASVITFFISAFSDLSDDIYCITSLKFLLKYAGAKRDWLNPACA